ncbi:hypothetical protein [Pseudooctadecabacter jejudonensis]|uniref:Flagellar FliJ protein n=1 Tax=Pseudooctadecabacter jejudonensis TaxID=1391910 RepID=A0A1Y5S486_9RHOB|nr:hypothetical protein [Pseudooctadecabacter jejudonensis]SLN32014.1 hypothetical protein PSJ8397_01491 [Pseudooctadecabacter jejudonensis]
MSAKLDQIQQLLPMLDMVYRAKQSHLQNAARRVQELRTQLAELDRPVSECFDDPSTRAGANLLWETWVIDRKKKINQEMAHAARDREEAKAKVAQALAKLEAARAVYEDVLREHLRSKDRRASW